MAEELVPIQENEYKELLLQTVAVIERARINVARRIATTASNTYWEIGRLLHEKKLESKHGSGVVKRLSVDLRERYPDMGLSPRQLWNMKSFYVRYKDCDEKLLRSVALLPWSQNLLLLNKDLSDVDTLYYAQESIAKGWNRDLLLNAIKLGMHETHSVPAADNNFESTLPAVQSQYANEVFHSTYNLGFLGVTKPILELELENRLVEKIKLFLLELGKGFTFIGNQHTIEYNGKESRVDMLFFHRGLRSLVAIDLLCCAQHIGRWPHSSSGVCDTSSNRPYCPHQQYSMDIDDQDRKIPYPVPIGSPSPYLQVGFQDPFLSSPSSCPRTQNCMGL